MKDLIWDALLGLLDKRFHDKLREDFVGNKEWESAVEGIACDIEELAIEIQDTIKQNRIREEHEI